MVGALFFVHVPLERPSYANLKCLSTCAVIPPPATATSHRTGVNNPWEATSAKGVVAIQTAFRNLCQTKAIQMPPSDISVANNILGHLAHELGTPLCDTTRLLSITVKQSPRTGLVSFWDKLRGKTSYWSLELQKQGFKTGPKSLPLQDPKTGKNLTPTDIAQRALEIHAEVQKYLGISGDVIKRDSMALYAKMAVALGQKTT